MPVCRTFSQKIALGAVEDSQRHNNASGQPQHLKVLDSTILQTGMS